MGLHRPLLVRVAASVVALSVGTPAASTVGTFLLIFASNRVGSAAATPTLVINAAEAPGVPEEPTPTTSTSPASSAPVAGSGSSPPETVAAVSSRPLASTGVPVGQLVGGATVLLLAGGSLLLLPAPADRRPLTLVSRAG